MNKIVKATEYTTYHPLVNVGKGIVMLSIPHGENMLKQIKLAAVRVAKIKVNPIESNILLQKFLVSFPTNHDHLKSLISLS